MVCCIGLSELLGETGLGRERTLESLLCYCRLTFVFDVFFLGAGFLATGPQAMAALNYSRQHGEVQCAELAREIGEARMKSVDYIVASPLQRMLNTALCIFQKLLKEKPGLKIIALPELQETSLLPCDVGSPIE